MNIGVGISIGLRSPRIIHLERVQIRAEIIHEMNEDDEPRP